MPKANKISTQSLEKTQERIKNVLGDLIDIVEDQSFVIETEVDPSTQSVRFKVCENLQTFLSSIVARKENGDYYKPTKATIFNTEIERLRVYEAALLSTNNLPDNFMLLFDKKLIEEGVTTDIIVETIAEATSLNVVLEEGVQKLIDNLVAYMDLLEPTEIAVELTER